MFCHIFHKTDDVFLIRFATTWCQSQKVASFSNKYKILSESDFVLSDFVDDVTKTLGVFWGLQFQLLFIYKTRTPSFTRQCSDIRPIQVSWKTFKLVYGNFLQENMYQILSQSVRFCRLYIKNILVCVSSVHNVVTHKYIDWLLIEHFNFCINFEFLLWLFLCQAQITTKTSM